MTTIGNLFYYIRLILLTTLLLTVLSAYATPSSTPAEPALTVASVSDTAQAGRMTPAAASIRPATALASEEASSQLMVEPATESSRFRETMRNFFGPNLNVKLRQ